MAKDFWNSKTTISGLAGILGATVLLATGQMSLEIYVPAVTVILCQVFLRDCEAEGQENLLKTVGGSHED